MHAIREIAPAKINLFLHVTGKREDGYHLLSSLVVFNNQLHDVITITDAEKFSFTMSGNTEGIAEKDNLVVKAAQLFSTIIGQPLNCAIALEKHIPIAAGLGGGSSDAAATIRALAKFWDIDVPETLVNALTELGADVPVCYYGKPCIMRGIGDIIEPLIYPLPHYSISLQTSQEKLMTKDIFAAFDQKFAPDIHASNLPAWEDEVALCEWLKNHSVNSLEKAAMSLLPSLKEALENDHGQKLTRLSGSGPTIFRLGN